MAVKFAIRPWIASIFAQRVLFGSQVCNSAMERLVRKWCRLVVKFGFGLLAPMVRDHLGSLAERIRTLRITDDGDPDDGDD